MTLKTPIIRILAWLTLTAIFGGIAAMASIYLYLSPKLPPVESLRQTKLQTPLRVFSSEGYLIGEFGEKRRRPIDFESAPEDFINALLAAEDDGFYQHSGVDIAGLLRAASQLVTSGQIQTGGSTITMQVARNFFLSRKQTFTRKFNEILLALQIESELSKEEILELYINKIYLGNRAYGIQSAAKVYYGKDIRELDLAQLAMIAGLPKAPSTFNPIVNPERALIRRNWILGRMLSLGMIDASQHNDAVKAPVTASFHGTKFDFNAPYIAEMARQKAIQLLGEAAYTDGYKVFTSIDAKLQQTAQTAVINGLLTYDQRHGYRGPEAQLPEPPAIESPAPETQTINETSLPAAFPPDWLKTLQRTPTLGTLTPAVVLTTTEKTASVLMADATIVELQWEDGFNSARPYIDENTRGSAPKTITDVVARGDLIRLDTNEDGRWQLSQIPAAQAALVAINPNNGQIKSLVGGFDFQQSHFNRATQAERQPGSNFKPFIYTAALEHGFTPATIINDAPIVFNDASLEGTWRPENASGKFFGPTRLRQALFKSRNLVSIRVLRSTGIQPTIAGMDRFGFDASQLPKDLSLALGSHAMTPLKVASAYTVFANGGYQIEPYLVERIVTNDDSIIYQANPLLVCKECEEETAIAAEESDPSLSDLEAALAAEFNSDEQQPSEPDQPRIAPRVIAPQVAYLIDDMLRDVIKKGTGRKAKQLGRNDLAGKTGTTNGPKDAWFSGYSSHMVTTTWLGFDENYNLGRREYGGTSALPIWIEYMREALAGKPEATRELPEGLISVRIDPATGKRAHPNTPDAIFETFRLENVPEFTQQRIEIDNQPADEALPEDLF
ncbi:MAG: penicillin-binding protein 1A [Candidatus Pelagadaptatus aseana]|uniref:penicillin-binding protein 1A n=1 Tax=Candidatus Pelagadaptatus aseana TaxID=3120508 RepID=UPI0039B291F0